MALLFGSKTTRANAGTGSTTTVGSYTLHTFTSGTNFTPTSSGMIDILAIGSGGPAFPAGQPYLGSGGGGAGAVIYRKFVPVVAATPYTITIGTNGSATSFGSLVTAPGGGAGGAESVNGTPAPGASGGGGGNKIPGNTGGTGAGVLGIGFPGGTGAPAGFGAGGGGAGGVGNNAPGPALGGPGTPITYFTGVSPNIVSVGGNGQGITPTSSTYGSGATAPSPSAVPGVQGALYIRYI